MAVAGLIRRSWIVAAGAVIVTAILFLVGMVTLYAQERAEDRRIIVLLERQAQERAEAVAELQEQIREIGERPVVPTPGDEIGPDATVPDTLDEDALPLLIADGIADYCALRNECRGRDGRNGLDGEVGATGVAIDGKDGEDGVDGRNGRNGTNGADGQPPPAEQIAALVAQEVASYCAARNDCRGADGTDGAQGQPGVDGQTPTAEEMARIVARVVASLTFTCTGEGTLTCTVD